MKLRKDWSTCLNSRKANSSDQRKRSSFGPSLDSLSQVDFSPRAIAISKTVKQSRIRLANEPSTGPWSLRQKTICSASKEYCLANSATLRLARLLNEW